MGGIGRYTWNLYQGLAARPDVDGPLAFARGRIIEDPSILLHGHGSGRRPFPAAFHRWRERKVLRNSLFHGPNYFLPPFAEGGVVTVHDLSVLRYPDTHPAERVSAFERNFQDTLRRARHVLTDTETVRKEVVTELGIPADRVTAVPLGVERSFRRHSVQEAGVLSGLGLTPGFYALSVAAFEPRKRIDLLIKAWSRLPVSLRTRFPLVLVGVSGWRNEHLQERIATGVREGWLRHLGFVPEAQLPAVYAGARLFLYPSIYEGFGLPPLEAMASGVPVLVSNRSCLPEVCGDAAMYGDPEDEPAYGQLIEQALTDEQWRSGAIGRGLTRAAEYSWDRCVSQTVAVYQEVAGAT